MPKSIIAEGKTTNEAIENGIKQLKVSKENVDIKVLENTEKRSFFSILTPRVVKVELTLKENVKIENKDITEKPKEREEREVTVEDINIATKNTEEFLKQFCKNFKGMEYKTNYEEGFLNVDISGEEESSKLIGYRGEVLNSLQVILNSIANKNCKNRVKINLNIGNYKEKRKKDLEELADKISKTVLRNGKSITLEPMMAYERKIIHSRLQANNNIKTYSIGEEPYRKIVISKNK